MPPLWGNTWKGKKGNQMNHCCSSCPSRSGSEITFRHSSLAHFVDRVSQEPATQQSHKPGATYCDACFMFILFTKGHRFNNSVPATRWSGYGNVGCLESECFLLWVGEKRKACTIKSPLLILRRVILPGSHSSLACSHRKVNC